MPRRGCGSNYRYPYYHNQRTPFRQAFPDFSNGSAVRVYVDKDQVEDDGGVSIPA